MTRAELDKFIHATTEPHNTGASADACRIVRMLFEHDGLLRVAVDDKENNAGFIAHLCRRVTQELKTINGETEHGRLAAYHNPTDSEYVSLSAEFIGRPDVSEYLDSAERSLEDCP